MRRATNAGILVALALLLVAVGTMGCGKDNAYAIRMQGGSPCSTPTPFVPVWDVRTPAVIVRCISNDPCVLVARILARPNKETPWEQIDQVVNPTTDGIPVYFSHELEARVEISNPVSGDAEAEFFRGKDLKESKP